MNRLIIKNGLIYDPINAIEGEKKDILVENGKIVDKFGSNKNIKEIDAKGKTVIPAALDVHTHTSAQQVNWARLLGSINTTFQEIWKGLTLENIAKDYISMGFTFILEANVFPSLAKQTIFNFQQMPVLDKGMLLNISNLWPLELEFQRDKIKDMAIFLSDILSKTFGFGFKVYNPFECEMWNFKEMREDLSKQGRLYNFSALDVYKNIVKCVKSMELPHSAHIHIEGYETDIGKLNLFTVLEEIKSLNLEHDQILHLAHANSYSSDGDNNELIKFLNENQNITADLSFLGFNQINPIITSDRRLFNSIFIMDSIENPHKLISSAIEFEGDSFVSMRSLHKNDFKACTLWANALDIVLNSKNKHQLSFSLNFPNYANITDIPKMVTWLVSKEARENLMKGMNDAFIKKNSLSSTDKELCFSDFVRLTRANPAKILGLSSIKGNLGPETDADINILDINIKDVDLSKGYKHLELALSNIEYVIKAGNIVKKDDKINMMSSGQIFWSEGQVEKEGNKLILTKKAEFYNKYSSMFYDSYKVSLDNRFLRKVK
jgi:formylmethanofuran dehydrogenase subunit A